MLPHELHLDRDDYYSDEEYDDDDMEFEEEPVIYESVLYKVELQVSINENESHIHAVVDRMAQAVAETMGQPDTRSAEYLLGTQTLRSR